MRGPISVSYTHLDGKLPDEPIELGIHGGLEHLVGGEGFGIAGFEADPLAALAMDAVCEGELQDVYKRQLP